MNAFFLNSKITQPAFQVSRKIEETAKYFEALVKEPESSEVGCCRITGQETKLFFGGRDNSIMTGSGTLINFHHFFQKGISLSKEALIRIHFVPFACQQLQGKISLMQSSNETLSKMFVKLTVEKNLHEIGVGLSKGVAKSDYNKPANAIFDFIDSALSQLNEFREGIALPSLTLYHFTNFGASPEIQMYQLPAKVFLFYRTCLQPRFKEDWQRFVRSHYYDKQHKGAKYNIQTEKFELTKSKETKVIDIDDYKQWFNPILNKLLIDENIRPEILRWSR
ncbi:MAG: type I-B CRISPR-associated protein Cas8b1/Cst1, partial [Mariniphaga sp.]